MRPIRRLCAAVGVLLIAIPPTVAAQQTLSGQTGTLHAPDERTGPALSDEPCVTCDVLTAPLPAGLQPSWDAGAADHMPVWAEIGGVVAGAGVGLLFAYLTCRNRFCEMSPLIEMLAGAAIGWALVTGAQHLPAPPR